MMENKILFFWLRHITYIFFLSFIGLFLGGFLLLSLFSILSNWQEYIQGKIYIVLKDSFNLSVIGSLLLTMFLFLKMFIRFVGGKGGNEK